MLNNIPIALFIYNRIDELNVTLSALKENFGIKEHTIIFFCDGPKENATQVDLEKINQVRSLIRKVDWCKNIIIKTRESNYGLATSIVSGITEVLTEHEAVIVLEDDIKTSPYFIKYMVDALNYYKDEEKVISISGFNHPIKYDKYSEETFFLKGADCWGWATWKRGWNLFEFDGQKLLDKLIEEDSIYNFDLSGTYRYSKMLKKTIKTNNSWAIKWHASAFINNKLSLCPMKSLVENVGIKGTNISISNPMMLGKICNEKQIEKFSDELFEDMKMRNLIIAHFRKYNSLNFRILNFLIEKINQIFGSKINIQNKADRTLE